MENLIIIGKMIVVFGGMAVIAILILGGFVMYGINIVKLVHELRQERYNLVVGLRAIGIFIPVVGVVMGFV